MYKLHANKINLDKAMKLKGVNNNTLTNKIGITFQHLSNVRNGRVSPSALLANSISKELKTPMNELFTLKEVEKDEATK